MALWFIILPLINKKVSHLYDKAAHQLNMLCLCRGRNVHPER